MCSLSVEISCSPEAENHPGRRHYRLLKTPWQVIGWTICFPPSSTTNNTTNKSNSYCCRLRNVLIQLIPSSWGAAIVVGRTHSQQLFLVRHWLIQRLITHQCSMRSPARRLIHQKVEIFIEVQVPISFDHMSPISFDIVRLIIVCWEKQNIYLFYYKLLVNFILKKYIMLPYYSLDRVINSYYKTFEFLSTKCSINRQRTIKKPWLF